MKTGENNCKLLSTNVVKKLEASARRHQRKLLPIDSSSSLSAGGRFVTAFQGTYENLLSLEPCSKGGHALGFNHFTARENRRRRLRSSRKQNMNQWIWEERERAIGGGFRDDMPGFDPSIDALQTRSRLRNASPERWSLRQTRPQSRRPDIESSKRTSNVTSII